MRTWDRRLRDRLMVQLRRNSKPFRLGLGTAAALAVAVSAVSLPVSAQQFGRLEIGNAAPSFALRGVDGDQHRLADYRGKIVVLEWTSPVCPYTQAKYDDGTIQALQEEAEDKGIVWLSINSTGNNRKPGYLSQSAARQRIASTKADPDAFLLDTDASVGMRYGAKTTPSFFILDKDGKIAYQGAIDDDLYADGNATKNYVRLAMNALSSGGDIETPQTRPYGCAVEY
jgi:hypothetical protein